MIGSDHPVFHHVLKEACGDQPNDPIARLTNLGWVRFGPTLVEVFRRNTHSHFIRTYRSSHVNKTPPPHDILRAFWELESLGIMDKSEQRMTAEERAAVVQVSETLEVRKGRYKVGISWKETKVHQQLRRSSCATQKPGEVPQAKRSRGHRSLQQDLSRIREKKLHSSSTPI